MKRNILIDIAQGVILIILFVLIGDMFLFELSQGYR